MCQGYRLLVEEKILLICKTNNAAEQIIDLEKVKNESVKKHQSPLYYEDLTLTIAAKNVTALSPNKTHVIDWN